jgi:hypothetical protein
VKIYELDLHIDIDKSQNLIAVKASCIKLSRITLHKLYGRTKQYFVSFVDLYIGSSSYINYS